MKKVIGYLISAVGLAGLAVFSIPALKTSVLAKLPFTIPASVTPQYLTIGSFVVLAVGVVLAFSGGGIGRAKAGQEVPIYQGKQIVGYRRG
jgi:hypothetical protein